MSNNADAQGKTKKCHALGASFVKTVALAVDLGAETVLDSPSMVKKILDDKAFQTAIAKALKAEAEKVMKAKKSGKILDWRESNAKMGKAVGSAAAEAAKNKAIGLIKATPEYKRLERGVKEFGCALDKSPVGVFVDRNKNWLLIIGVVGSIGGAVAMYYTKSGDVPAKAFELIPKLKPIKIGNVSIKASQVKFQPSTRTVQVELGTTIKWDTVKADFKVKSSFKNDHLVGASGTASVVINPESSMPITGTTTTSWVRDKDEKGEAVKSASALTVKRIVSSRTTVNFQLVHKYEYFDSKHQHTFGGELSESTSEIFGKGTMTTFGVRGETKFGAVDEYKGEVFLRITFGK